MVGSIGAVSPPEKHRLQVMRGTYIEHTKTAIFTTGSLHHTWPPFTWGVISAASFLGLLWRPVLHQLSQNAYEVHFVRRATVDVYSHETEH